MVQHIQVEDDMRAVYVDTNLQTHLLCHVSLLSDFDQLKDQIVKDHDEFGNITINSLKVMRDQKRYHLARNMLLKTAFHGAKTWTVFANVNWAPVDHSPKALSIPVRKLQLNMANHEHVLNLQVPNPLISGKKKRSRRDFAPESLTSNPSVLAENIHNSNVLENSLKFSFEGGAPKPKQLVNKKKGKRKKHDHTSSNLLVEKGNENERISLVSHQLQSEVPGPEQMKVIGVESFRPPQLSTPRVNGEIASVKPKKRMQKKRSTSGDNSSTVHMEQQLNANTQKTVVEQADLTPNHKVNDVDSQEKGSLHEKTHDGSTEVRRLDNQPPSNLKSKKLDGQNLIIPNSEVSERNAQAGTELQNNVQESELSDQLGTKRLPLHQISQHEEHLNVPSVEVVKPVEKTPTLSVNDLPEVEQRDFLLTNGTDNATKHKKGISASEGHYNDLNDIPFQEVSSNLAEMASPKKLRASEQKVENTDVIRSVVAVFKEENLTISTSSKQVMNNQVPLGDTVNYGVRKLGQNNPARKSGVLRPNLNARRKSPATSSLISVKSSKTIHKEENTEVQKKKQETVFKTPSNKNMGIPVNSLAQKKTLPALSWDLSNDCSDNEVERSGSSCNIGTVDDSSSSDSSESESEGEPKGSRSARDAKNLDLSALKGMDVASVLRSSSRYKWSVEQAALQSQMEDGKTEPVESVADSYSD